MAGHEIKKSELILKLSHSIGKTLGELDNVGLFEKHKLHPKVKGIAGDVIEQCVIGYPADTEQKPDLSIDNIPWELKTTGMKKDKKGNFIAKEPMSITGVGIYDLSKQTFENSHFWQKVQRLLLIYYFYNSSKAVTAYEYRNFVIESYDFHEFSNEDIDVLKKDWYIIHDFIKNIEISIEHPKGSQPWKDALLCKYLENRHTFKKQLSFIDLAPKFPPRFRLRKPVVNTIIGKHFGYITDNTINAFKSLSEIELECLRLTDLYSGKTIRDILRVFGINNIKENKGISEQLIIRMFGGNAKKLNQVELFSKYGIIAKSITVTETGARTEDMKLFPIDFNELIKTHYEIDNSIKTYEFEDSDFYAYFNDYKFLCIIFEEPKKSNNEKISLLENKFIGFKIIQFSEPFIMTYVYKLWNYTRNQIINNELEMIQYYKNGNLVINKSGSIKEAPNFMKSSENPVFIRGGTATSSEKHKTECVNGLKMIPQYVWIKGTTIVKMLNLKK